MSFKRMPLLFVMLFLSTGYLLGMGLGDWEAITKNGTHFYSPGSTIITLANGESYEYPRQWYFYRNHIVGVKKDYDESNFFVIDEKKQKVYSFEEENSWKEFIELNKLSPKIWTRWFDSNWNHIESISMWSVLAFPISIPMALLNIYFYIKLKASDKNKETWVVLASITPAIILVMAILGLFPESL